jgi:hypothetical protein
MRFCAFTNPRERDSVISAPTATRMPLTTCRNGAASATPAISTTRRNPCSSRDLQSATMLAMATEATELETENYDLNHGNSGGAMFAWWSSGTDPRVVGVVNSQVTNAQQLRSLRRHVKSSMHVAPLRQANLQWQNGGTAL